MILKQVLNSLFAMIFKRVYERMFAMDIKHNDIPQKRKSLNLKNMCIVFVC